MIVIVRLLLVSLIEDNGRASRVVVPHHHVHILINLRLLLFGLIFLFLTFGSLLFARQLACLVRSLVRRHVRCHQLLLILYVRRLYYLRRLLRDLFVEDHFHLWLLVLGLEGLVLFGIELALLLLRDVKLGFD